MSDRPGRHRRRPLRLLLAGAVLLIGVVGTAGPAGGASDPPAETTPRRVLIVSVPRLTWRDVLAMRPPTILGLLDQSAVASMSLRTIGPRTSLGEGYATIGAGNRAGVSDINAGTALGPSEPFEDGTAAQTYRRRTGRAPTADVLQLDIAAVVDINDQLLFGAVPGSLGTALAASGWSPAVVGNGDLGVEGLPVLEGLAAAPGPPTGGATPSPGDGTDEPEAGSPDAGVNLTTVPFTSINRSLALALMDEQGRVPEGDVERTLLGRDPRSPFGVKTDGPAMERAFDEVWRDRSVVLMEMSDLDRADQYARAASASQDRVMRRRAVADADKLLARILRKVDPERDLVMLVAPAAPRAREEPTPFAMRGPGVRAGLTSSGTTRRPGYVTLSDMAPTILDRLAIDEPSQMNGALIAERGHGGTGLDQYRDLAVKNTITKFRDQVAGPVSVWFVVLELFGDAFAVFSLTGSRQRLRPWAAFVALAILAFPTVTFLLGLGRADLLGSAGFTLTVFAGAAVLALLAQQAGFRFLRRNDPRAAMVPPLLLIGLLYTVLVLDVVTGSRLQINTVFGYSPVVAGRFAGYGNLAFALLAMSTVVLSTGVWGLARIKESAGNGRRSRVGIPVVVALFLVAIVADGYPAFGSDVGGVLALVPAGAVVVVLLSGRRLNARRLLGIGVATALSLVLFAGIDLTRPPDQRTHLGRLVTSTAGQEGGGLGTVIQRKLAANLNVLTSSTFIWIIPAALATLAFLTWRRRGFIRTVMDVVPGMKACLWGGIVVAVLGFALNDSGMTIPAMMLPVLVSYLIHLVVQPDSGPDAQAPKWLEALLARLERDDTEPDGRPPADGAGTGDGGAAATPAAPGVPTG